MDCVDRCLGREFNSSGRQHGHIRHTSFTKVWSYHFFVMTGEKRNANKCKTYPRPSIPAILALILIFTLCAQVLLPVRVCQILIPQNKIKLKMHFSKQPYFTNFLTIKFQWTFSFNSRRIRLGSNFQSLAFIVSWKFFQKLIFLIERGQGHLFLTDNQHSTQFPSSQAKRSSIIWWVTHFFWSRRNSSYFHIKLIWSDPGNELGNSLLVGIYKILLRTLIKQKYYTKRKRFIVQGRLLCTKTGNLKIYRQLFFNIAGVSSTLMSFHNALLQALLFIQGELRRRWIPRLAANSSCLPPFSVSVWTHDNRSSGDVLLYVWSARILIYIRKY